MTSINREQVKELTCSAVLLLAYLYFLVGYTPTPHTGLGNETGKFQNIKKNRHMDFHIEVRINSNCIASHILKKVGPDDSRC